MAELVEEVDVVTQNSQDTELQPSAREEEVAAASTQPADASLEAMLNQVVAKQLKEMEGRMEERMKTGFDDQKVELDKQSKILDKRSKILERLVRATPRAAAPEDGFVVDVGVEAVMLKSVVSGGEATWSILKREKHFYAVSSLHAAIPYESKVAGELIVDVPIALRGLVDAVGFVVGNDEGDTKDEESSGKQVHDELENGWLVAQGGDTPIHRDIVFLRLKLNPVSNSVIWHDDTDYMATKRIDCVSGYSHSQMVTGYDAKFWKAKGSNEGYYVFTLESGEEGNSGALMFPSPDDHQTGGKDMDKSVPHPLGVFYGRPSNKILGMNGDEKKPPGPMSGRAFCGAICPLVPFSCVTWVSVKKATYKHKDHGELDGLSVKVRNVRVLHKGGLSEYLGTSPPLLAQWVDGGATRAACVAAFFAFLVLLWKALSVRE